MHTGEPGRIIVWRHDPPRKAGASVKRKTSFFVDGGALSACAPPLATGHRPEGERMLAVQPRLPLVLALQPGRGRVRRPFHPIAGGEGPTACRATCRTASRPLWRRSATERRPSPWRVFLARFWSAPGRIVEAFPIDRRALADHGELDLTEKRIRGAIRTLEEIGFLDRAVTSGSRYKPTEDGLRRKPIRFRFGSEYAPLLLRPTGALAAARGRRSGDRQVECTPNQPSGPLRSICRASPLKGPKSKSEAERSSELWAR